MGAWTLSKEIYRKRLVQVQRREVLGISSAYRAVSKPAALVITDVILIALLGREHKTIFHRKGKRDKPKVSKDERSHMYDSW